MIAFNDLIALLRGRVSIYHNARVCGDWLIREHTPGITCFHLATQGTCKLDVPEQGHWLLAAGDVVIFPRELPHTMTPVQPLRGRQRHLPLAESQHLEGTSMLCGAVNFEHRCGELLLDLLPPVLVIERAAETAWLAPLVSLILDESLRDCRTDNPVLARLCDLLFAYSLRHYVESQSPRQGHGEGPGEDRGEGLLALFVHPRINQALLSLHAAPEKNWQLQSLAECAAMSRTRFAEVFKAISGFTPMQYLTWWRMQLAWSYLETGSSVAAVASRVGYRSEAAFSRTFRKHFGKSAGAVRRQRPRICP